MNASKRSFLPPPHGGTLVDRRLEGRGREEALARSARLPRLPLGPREVSDLEMIATGGLSPLTGFMGSRDHRSVVEERRLACGLPWTIPITLPIPEGGPADPRPGDEVVLTGADGTPLALLRIEERFRIDREREAQAVFRTTDRNHPGVAALARSGAEAVGGPIDVLDLPRHEDFLPYRIPPRETRARFEALGWRRVVGFQTRNPVHRAHEYLQKCALEVADGLLLHPLVGETKGDDVPAATRMRCYEALLAGYYPQDRVVLAVNPAAMRYAGPSEAIFHALIRKNYGCTHFIVGRDHAGVGSYYGPYDAQRIFDEFDPTELGIAPLFFDNAFFCRSCGGMATVKTCPHGEEVHVTLSGTKVREMLRRGELPPQEFSRPEVARLLAASLSALPPPEGKG